MATILQFKELVNRFRNLGRVERRVELLRNKLRLHYYRLTEMEEEVARAGLRTERLEKFHPAQLYAKFMNRHREELSEAKQTYFELAGSYNRLLAATELIEFEIDVLTEKLNDGEEVGRELIDRALTGQGVFVRMFPEMKTLLLQHNKKYSSYHTIKADTHKTLIALAEAKDALRLVDMTLNRVRRSGSFLHAPATIERDYLMAQAARQELVVRQKLGDFMGLLKDLRNRSNRLPKTKGILIFRSDYFKRKFRKNWVYNRQVRLSRQAIHQSLGELENLRKQIHLLQQTSATEMEVLTKESEHLVLGRLAA